MKITYDPDKRQAALEERALDFEDAAEVFDGLTVDVPDERFDYGELRIISFGMLRGRLVVVGWTPRGNARHVFSMMKANARERKKIGERFGAR